MPFDLVLTEGGTKCAQAGRKPSIWVGAADRRRVVKIVRVSSQEQESMGVAPNEARPAWPTAVPMVSGAQYQSTIDGKSLQHWRLMVSSDEALDGRASLRWMVEAGCSEQALRLLDSLPPDIEIPAERPDGLS